MSDAEFDRLDILSAGKLRHLLVGSPSGYSWSEDVSVTHCHDVSFNLYCNTVKKFSGRNNFELRREMEEQAQHTS